MEKKEKKDRKIRIFSALEIANICGVVNQTTINWIKNGFLKAFTTPGGQYRVYSDDLYNFLKSRGMRIPEELLGEDMYKKLLIIDDDETLNNILKKTFTKILPHLSIRQAFDGFEAGRIISDWSPGVIILDINLPGINGHELCKRIKSDIRLGDPLILAISGLDDPKEKDLILKEGAERFWSKPFDIKAIAIEIQEMVNERSK